MLLHHITEDLSREYRLKHEKYLPDLICHVHQRKDEEAFTSNFDRGKLKVVGNSEKGLIYGISQLTLGLTSGHLTDFIGDSEPRFSLRPLWIHTQVLFSDRLCRRILELGYNAIILEDQDPRPFHDYGIKVISKPKISLPDNIPCCPLNEEFKQWVGSYLKERIHGDYFFWESFYLNSNFFSNPSAQGWTLAELVGEEARLIENCLPEGVSLIFFVPTYHQAESQQLANWLPKLCDSVGNRTLVSFSTVSGNYCDDHLPPHPFWEKLRQMQIPSSTQLLPILNSGFVRQGGGLWPALALDSLEWVTSHMRRHSFAGMICASTYLPTKGSLLDCNLWIASQTMWRTLSPELLASTWFKAHHPEVDFAELCRNLRTVRELIKELSSLKSKTNEASRDAFSSEECRTMTESLLARLRDLHQRAEKTERMRLSKAQKPTFYDALLPFIKDAQRTILYFLQCYNLSFPLVLNGEDLEEGFWTKLFAGSGQGIRSSSKVIFLDEPNRGRKGSKMEAVFLENNIFASEVL